MSISDLDLLHQYARAASEAAFTELVNRHLNLVYSAALRQVRSPQLAEEVSQSVFNDLARSATRLKPGTVLTAWLYQVTRRTAIDVVRRESRRQAREQIAVEIAAMNTTTDWSHIEPLLDEGMDALDETDRAAILLRYFENKSLREVGAALGTSDDAAQKRVNRAVERLRESFVKRGVTVGASGLVVIISAHAVQAAPMGLNAAIATTSVIAGKTIVTSATATATKFIAMTLLQKTLVTATVVTALAAGTGAYLVHQRHAEIARRMATPIGTAHPPGTYISNAELVRAGFATPEATLETLNWATGRGTYEQIIEGFSPDLLANLSQNPKFREGIESSQAEVSRSLKGMQIIAKKVLTDDKVELKVKEDYDLAAMKKTSSQVQPEFYVRQMVKVGNQWKLTGPTPVYDPSWDTSGKIQSYVP